VTRPAEIDLSGISRIAFGDITGIGSGEFAGELSAALFSTGRFEILDRQHLAQMLREHQIGASGLMDPQTVAELGRLVGSAALVFGQVTEHRFNETSEVGDPFTDKQGRTHRTYSRTGVARVAITLQITDITSGRVVAIKQLSAEAEKSVSKTDAQPPQIDPSPYLAAARAKCVAAFVRAVAPTSVREDIAFEKDDKLPGTERAIAFAQGGDLARAAAIFQEVASQNPANARAHYNLGLVQLCLGQHDDAIASLDRAFGMTALQKYGRELARAREWKANAERLRQQNSGAATP
jgi:tetratricopeptide (TPR) repeat protein